MRILITLLAVGLLGGCAVTLTEEEAAECVGDEACLAKVLEGKKEDIRYAIEERDIEYRDEYYRFAAWCRASGGVIYIVRHFPTTSCRGNCPAKFGDSYSCGSPPSM